MTNVFSDREIIENPANLYQATIINPAYGLNPPNNSHLMALNPPTVLNPPMAHNQNTTYPVVGPQYQGVSPMHNPNPAEISPDGRYYFGQLQMQEAQNNQNHALNPPRF